MSQPKRLNAFLEADENGLYVYHSDYAALAAENEQLKASIQQSKWISDALKPVQSEESGTITIKAPVSSGKTVLVDLFAVEELKAENRRLAFQNNLVKHDWQMLSVFIEDEKLGDKFRAWFESEYDSWYRRPNLPKWGATNEKGNSNGDCSCNGGCGC